MERVAHQARTQGADLVLFPEMFITGYSIGPEAVDKFAKRRDGFYRHCVSHIARAAGLSIVFGYPELSEDGRIFNAAQWINAGGEVVINYRKTHLYGDLDRSQFSAGDISDVNSKTGVLNGWEFGLLICYDVEFPESTRRLALAGADCVLVLTANMDTYNFVSDTMVPTRAFENQIVMAYANYCGHEGRLNFGGLSAVVDALGRPLAKAAREECILTATLYSEALDDARLKHTHLQEQARFNLK